MHFVRRGAPVAARFSDAVSRDMVAMLLVGAIAGVSVATIYRMTIAPLSNLILWE